MSTRILVRWLGRGSFIDEAGMAHLRGKGDEDLMDTRQAKAAVVSRCVSIVEDQSRIEAARPELPLEEAHR